MKGRKVLAFCLSMSMIFSSFSMAFAEETNNIAATNKFADTNGHWAATAIEKWAGYGVLNGLDGSFRPNDYITRAEMATLLDNMMDYQVAAKNTFSDVSTGAWYEAAVLKTNAAGILNGDGAGHANPTAKITKEQAALMLARAFSV
ncbi:MAG TPA: S-layer homology domain-containing protein, partial [Anaerovoracaceae bacterium]|nr:S-layer homology domain-containing protein [Anaerovoracaceae bacterium]